MHSFRDLLTALGEVDRNPFSGCVYRVIPYQYRDTLLSSVGARMNGGRYNPPHEFGILYTCDSQLTAHLEVNALFVDPTGKLVGVPRNPDLMLTLDCELLRVLDLRRPTIQQALGTSLDELISNIPSRHILNPKGQLTPTQILGRACYKAGTISALLTPSAANADGFCLDVLPDRLVKGEWLSILDSEGSLTVTLAGPSEGNA